MNWRIPKHRIWPIIIVLVLTIDVGVGVVMMNVASDDPTFAVESDYYAKAVAWDSNTAQAGRNHALQWRLTPQLGPVAADRQSTLTMRLLDSSGTAVRGARMEVEAMPVSHAEEIVRSELAATPIGGDYAASLPMNRSGLWEVRVVATRGPDQFTADLRLDVSQSVDATVVASRPWDPDPARVRAGMRQETGNRTPGP